MCINTIIVHVHIYNICFYSYRCIYVSYSFCKWTSTVPFHRWPFSVLSLRTLVICSCISLQLPVPMAQWLTKRRRQRVVVPNIMQAVVDSGLRFFWGHGGSWGHESEYCGFFCCSKKRGGQRLGMPRVWYDSIYVQISQIYRSLPLWVDVSAPSFIWIETVETSHTTSCHISSKQENNHLPTDHLPGEFCSFRAWLIQWFPKNIHWFAIDVLQILRIFKTKVK